MAEGSSWGFFVAAVNRCGRQRAYMRLDHMPSIRSVIETLEKWEQADPQRRIVISGDADRVFPDLEDDDG